ncbi:glycosyltransferase [Catenovulum maritimum]|uniref:Spore protein YkvP/CgeB glycosyl transferase-like domain-containing protein n=1 Tax=Catenovulum maritimum TaxID=1513271 RepID=A0A0J8GVD4_9ALTE|nr:glycosyltransferase [Catenovulum maritimum]KMT64633.1 hypothetical protein XM47_13400 [Catenovulum maritimum]
MKTILSKLVLDLNRWFENTYVIKYIRLCVFIYEYYLKPKVYKSDKKIILIKTCNPANKNRFSWGDYHLAEALANSIELDPNYKCIMVPIDFWHSQFLNNRAFKIIFIRGVYSESDNNPYFDKTYMYLISHPEKVSGDELARYKGVIVASLKLYDELKSINKYLHYIPQFTDEERFKPQIDKSFEHDVLFVGNTRGIYRESVKYCIENDINIDVYGAGWDKFIPQKYIKGHHISNAELPKHYANAKITLNDHWQTMRDQGFISNRVFDVTACGGFLLTDHFDEIETLFQGAVKTYYSESDLVSKINYYLEQDQLRKDSAISARQITLAKHSKAAIGKAFCDIINE